MKLRPWGAAVILGAGAVMGLGWNGLSSRGLALTQNAFVNEGDEVIRPA